MITVLRLNHRPERDKRITTHVALVARAFGADRMVYTGTRDTSFESSVMDVVARWGGDFTVEYNDSWKQVLTDFDGITVHLTMYGLGVDSLITEIRTRARDAAMLVVVGGEKVPSEVYNLVDYNVAIGHQPHSEVAALAVFLDRFFEGDELNHDFRGRVRIIPQERGKKLVSL